MVQRRRADPRAALRLLPRRHESRGGLPLARSTPRVERDGTPWPAAYFRLVLDAAADLLPSAAHPAGVGVAGMTFDEKMTLARWIDLGAPIDLGTPWGFLEDDLRPTLVLRPSVAAARAAGTLDALQIAAFDAESGVLPASLTVTCNLRLGPSAPGANLAAGKALDPEGSVLRLLLPRRVRLAERPVFTVSVRDAAGQTTRIVRTFSP